MSISNQAAWVDKQGAAFRVGPADMYQPGKGELLIKVQAIGINPIDGKQINSGLFVESWPTLVGIDGAGEVIQVGEGVSAFKVGQKVLASFPGLSTQKPKHRTFQQYAVALQGCAAVIPKNVSYESACVVPLVMNTAALGLYAPENLGLPLPTANVKEADKTLIVWGAASGVGMAATQLARASGVDVVATASPKNFDLIKSLGAKVVLDYNSSNIAKDLEVALKGSDCIGAFNAAASGEAMIRVAEMVKAIGVTKLATSVVPRGLEFPPGIEVKSFNADNLVLDEKFATERKGIWEDFLPEALRSGQFQFLPEPLVAGNGLESLQQALLVHSRGVSARKVVVKLQDMTST